MDVRCAGVNQMHPVKAEAGTFPGRLRPTHTLALITMTLDPHSSPVKGGSYCPHLTEKESEALPTVSCH